MIPIYQTQFGGKYAPDDQKGNCWQAAVASILELPMGQAFDLTTMWEDDEWFERFQAWLRPYGLSCVALDMSDPEAKGRLSNMGYHLIETESVTLKNGEYHIVVGYDGEVVHDPNPNAEEVGKLCLWFLFVALDPADQARAHRLLHENIRRPGR